VCIAVMAFDSGGNAANIVSAARSVDMPLRKTEKAFRLAGLCPDHLQQRRAGAHAVRTNQRASDGWRLGYSSQALCYVSRLRLQSAVCN